MDWDALTADVMRVCRDTFSTPIIYTPKNGEPYETLGIFDAEYRDTVLLDGALLQTTQPRLGMHLDDLVGRRAFVGDRVIVKGVEYRVIEFNPDGQAGATMMLETVKA